METIDWGLPNRWILGAGALTRLGELVAETGAWRVLCVADPGVAAAGHLVRAVGFLEAAGRRVAAFGGVHENPTTFDVEAGLAVAKHAGIDAIVAVGGGSVLDCAKGINFLYCCGGRVEDYRGKGRATRALLPLIAVPTTAGTGSESQSFAIISDPTTHQKMACGDRTALPRVALLDPELTLTLPRAVTASTGIDALSHAVESYVTLAGNTVSRMLAREAFRLIIASLPLVLAAPGDLEARSHMLLGASLAGAAIEASMLGAAHSAANPLTARHDVVHGRAVGLMLPHVIRFNAPTAREAYRELTTLSGLAGVQDPADALARRIEELLDAAGLPRRLRDLGVEEQEVEILAAEAASQWTARFNPRPVTARELAGIYRRAL